MSSETQFFIYYSKSQLLKTYPVKKMDCVHRIHS